MRRLVSTSLAAVTLFSLSGCAEWVVDAELEKLCKAEGGIKVFEVVKLPADQIRPDGYPVFLRPSSPGVPYVDRLGSEYRLVAQSTELNRVLWVKLMRSTESIIRASDGKVLGKLSVFSRHGGGIPLSEGAGNICPKPPFGLNLIKSVFIVKK